MPVSIFSDTKPKPKLPQNFLEAEKMILGLSETFLKVAAASPKSFSVFRRAFDQPYWTADMFENTAKAMKTAANSLIRGDNLICTTILSNIKNDFGSEASRHRKASKYLLVGRGHVKAAEDFSNYGRLVDKVLDCIHGYD